ncbi:hypothetical protein JTB14_012451 [Gonioctena quinquepunctata]|nr:hypothetical protein JTB14_012451 [Gonioctena quinquepunctata]
MELFKDICVGKMNLQVNDSCFEACYRIGKKEYNTNRPIMVKCSTNLLKNLRGFNQGQLGIVKEPLKKVGIDGKVWTNSGTIFIRYKDEEQARKINTAEDLKRQFV